MWHPRFIGWRRARITSHGSLPRAQQHQEARTREPTTRRYDRAMGTDHRARITPGGGEPGAGSVGFLVVRPERAQRHLEGVQPAADDLRLPRVGATRSPFGAHRRADCLQ